MVNSETASFGLFTANRSTAYPLQCKRPATSILVIVAAVLRKRAES